MGAGITPRVKYINICTTKYKKQDWDRLKAYTYALPLHISLI